MRLGLEMNGSEAAFVAHLSHVRRAHVASAGRLHWMLCEAPDA